MFQPWKSDNGAVPPWEYLPAEAGTYHVGQALNLDATTGHLEAVAAGPWIPLPPTSATRR